MTRTLIALLCLVLTTPLLAQAPAAEPAAVRLGQPYESQTGGIALRPPAGSSEIRRGGDPDLIVEFVHEKKEWTLKVHRLTFTQPMPMTMVEGVSGPPGVLDATAEQFRTAQVNVEILRQDVVNLGPMEMGMLAARYGLPKARKLAQQAIIKADSRVFYTITMNSRTEVPPPDDRKDEEEDRIDPLEREAVYTFKAVLDTVQILDRAHIKQEQDERLQRTQLLLPSFTEEVYTKAIIPEQWLRLIRDGQDIGYSYVVEEASSYNGHPGVLVSSRTRTIPEEGVRADVSASMFISYNRRREWWTTTGVLNTEGQRTDMTEVGTSDERIRRVVVKPPSPLEVTDPALATRGEPVVHNVKERLLSVTRKVGRQESEPFTRTVPPYYLPHATAHLLPRLLPLDEPKGYLFVSYIADQQELMFRYIDVGLPETVDILGKKVTAVPVADRIGLQGLPTIHYISPEGEYLGSKSTTMVGEDESTSWIIPSDADTIKARWADAQLTKPEANAPKEPAGNGR